MTSNDDLMALTGDITKLAQHGNFNPFSLIAGENRFHSLFLAPFSPALGEAIARFRADGTGPLEDVVRVFQSKGASPADALQQARQMFTAAQAMLVVVMAGDHGPSTIPQLFFGSLDDAFCAHALAACGDGFPAAPAFTAAVNDVRSRHAGGATWPALFAGPGVPKGPAAYWDDIGRMIVGGMDGGVMPGTSLDRLRDLAHWAAAGRIASPGPLTAPTSLQIIRLLVLAGEDQAAATRLDGQLVSDADADALVELVIHLADAALARHDPLPSTRWIAAFIERFETLFGISYELRLAAFRLHAGAASPAAAMLAAAGLLMAANRKSARQDLTREPIWRVVIAEPGVLLDTTAAATAVGRSTTFLAKRLESRTIPYHRRTDATQGDQVRVPEQALLAWKAVMDAHKLLD